MDHKLERKRLRQVASPIGWALLIYLMLMNLAVMVVAMVDTVVIYIELTNGADYTREQIDTMVLSNGWGYLLTILVGMVALRVWQGREFCTRTLWTRGRPMKAGDFWELCCIFVAGQLVFTVLAPIQESILNFFGLSALSSVEAATMSNETWSMYLYACIGAPIAEELVFRGMVLRLLEPHGKRLAIFGSAFAFSIFHGNLVQIPYTFLVGLILGYVAVEYNIVWAMLLHMINNLVLADMISRLTVALPAGTDSLIQAALILLCGIGAVGILLARRQDIRRYHRENPMKDAHVAGFLTAPGMVAMMVATVVTLLIPLVQQAMG